jgi:hypothetical protein
MPVPSATHLSSLPSVVYVSKQQCLITSFRFTDFESQIHSKGPIHERQVFLQSASAFWATSQIDPELRERYHRR